MNDKQLSIVNPLESLGGTIEGFISSRLMAAYKLDHEHTVHVSRESSVGPFVLWHYVLERNDDVIFEGTELRTTAGATYGEAARDLMGFLTQQEHDVDDEYFADYTPEQLAWRDECAEDLVMFGMEPEDEGD